MRLATRARLSTLVLALAGMSLSLPGSPAAAATAATAAADIARPLPVQSVRGVAADAFSHVYVATDAGVLVTDTAGNRLRTISYNQVLDLALSRDGSRLYLAERGNVALSVFDTKTLKQVARHVLPPGMCPISIAPTTRYIAFGFACDGGQGGVGFLSLANPKAKPVTFTSGSFAYNPLVRALPTGDSVLAASAGSSSGTDVAVVSPTRVVREGLLESCLNLQDLAVAPDGRSFVPACGWPYRFDRYSTTALAITGTMLATAYPSAVAFSPSGRLLAGGVNAAQDPDLWTYPAAASPRRPVELGGSGVTKGLAFSPTGKVIYAIARTPAGKYVLHTAPGERTGSA